VDRSSSKTIDQFKSPIRVAAKILLRSRETQKQRATANRRTINKLKDDITKLRQENLQLAQNKIAPGQRIAVRQNATLSLATDRRSVDVQPD